MVKSFALGAHPLGLQVRILRIIPRLRAHAPQRKGHDGFWHIAANLGCLLSRLGGILLQKSFEHLCVKHWFKIKQESATTIQKDLRADSIVSNFNFKEPARRLLQQNRWLSRRAHTLRKRRS
jgi:hypothetical protein